MILLWTFVIKVKITFRNFGTYQLQGKKCDVASNVGFQVALQFWRLNNYNLIINDSINNKLPVFNIVTFPLTISCINQHMWSFMMKTSISFQVIVNSTNKVRFSSKKLVQSDWLGKLCWIFTEKYNSAMKKSSSSPPDTNRLLPIIPWLG